LKRLSSHIVFILCCLSFISTTRASSSASSWLNDSVYYYIDSLNEEEISTIEKANFAEVGRRELNFAGLNKNVWIKIHLPKSTGLKRFLLIDYPLIDSLSLWVFNCGELEQGYQTGSHTPFITRPINDNLFLFALPNHRSTVYIKAWSRLNLQLPLRLIDQDYIENTLDGRDFLQSVYLGLMILAILGSLIIGLFNRGSKVFFAYVGHLIGTLFITLHIGGYAFMYFWPEYPQINIYEPWIFGLGIFSTLFSMEFLDTRNQAPKLNRLLWVSLIFNFSIFPLLILGKISLANQIVQIVGLLGCLLMLIAGFILYRRGFKPARFFILAWSIFLLGVMITILQRLSIIPLSELSLHASQIGSALEVILLFAALADKVHLIQEERDKAKEAALIALTENKTNIEAQNQILERRISEKIQELNNKNMTLEKINEQQNNILSIIGHDLKGPIASLGQALNLMRNDKNLITTEFLDMLQSSTINTFSLLENLLSWSQSKDSSYKPDLRKIDIKGLCQNIIALNQPTLFQKRIKLEFNFEGLCFALADERMILTVLRNLLNNAIKFSPKGSTITIQIIKEIDSVEIEICDQGQGINPTLINKILSGNSLQSQQGTSGELGSGFGLRISLDFLSKMSSRMEISSEINGGSCFKVVLPAVH
jgi:signal transduction histidine kinase